VWTMRRETSLFAQPVLDLSGTVLQVADSILGSAF